MTSDFGLNSLEIDVVHTIDPALAAHNIALAYVSSSTKLTALSQDEEVISDDVLSLSMQYVEAYNYAYNYVTHKNELIENAE